MGANARQTRSRGPTGVDAATRAQNYALTKTPAADEVIGEPLIRVPVLPARETTVIIRSLAAAAPTIALCCPKCGVLGCRTAGAGLVLKL